MEIAGIRPYRVKTHFYNHVDANGKPIRIMENDVALDVQFRDRSRVVVGTVRILRRDNEFQAKLYDWPQQLTQQECRALAAMEFISTRQRTAWRDTTAEFRRVLGRRRRPR